MFECQTGQFSKKMKYNNIFTWGILFHYICIAYLIMYLIDLVYVCMEIMEYIILCFNF